MLDTRLFPDGYKTSGQHGPIESQLFPYSEFPKQISGPALWNAEDYHDHDERWKRPFSPEEISEINHAAEAFIASGAALTGISKVSLASGVR